MKIVDIICYDLFEAVSRDNLLKDLQKKRESEYMDMILKKMHELIQKYGSRQSIGGYAFDISRMLGNNISARSLEQLYREKYMNEEHVVEWGRIVKGVNTTVDVGPDEIKTQAAKFGNRVDRDGRPPLLGKKVKGSKTNVLQNLGLSESVIFEKIAPHGTPENEFELMMAGKKPATIVSPDNFKKYYKPVVDEKNWPYKQISLRNSKYDNYVVAQAGNSSRVETIVSMIEKMNTNLAQGIKPDNSYHIRLGRLLGYSDADIEYFLNSLSRNVKEDWQNANKRDRTDGMSSKAVKAYRRENPGSKLKTAVTKDPKKIKKGSADSKRRSSFCARSNGQRKMHNIDCSKTPDKPICKARKRWSC
jgi:hypothetical protein